MSNINWDDEDDDTIDTDYSGFAGQDSDLLKKLRKAKRSDEKRIKELTDQLEIFSKQQRERTVKEVLEKKGVNPKLARLALRDIEGELSEDAVNNWVNDYADVFGIKIDNQVTPEANELDLAALRQQDIVTQSAITPNQAQDAFARIDGAQSAEEIIAMIHGQS